MINAGGILNAWKWPDIEGLESFHGPRLHSANWDDSVALTKDVKVSIIGNGSSAIQILPKLQPKVAHIDTYIRTKTWIALPFTSENVKERAIANGTATTDSAADVLIDPETSNPPYTEAEKKAFAEDSELLRRYRKKIEQENNSRFAGSTLKGSPGAEAAIPRLTAIMKKRLAKKPELADLLIPDWHVGCRRLTPGVGYLESLCEDNVDVITTGIERIVPEGIQTKDGKVHECDVLICATGFDVSTRPHFDVVGRNGHIFTDEFAKTPKGYLTLTMSGMPNYFIFNGPNAPIANGSLIPAMEKEGDYMIKMIEKMIREDIRSMCIKKQAEEDFTAYVDAWMPRSIWSSGCRSWYKGGTIDGRVSGLWPGSILHFMEILKNPRYEDYDYTYLSSRNPFSFLGNGFTLADITPGSDTAPYLDTAYIEV
ncbi:hypothetical protein P389DRAFT_175398 [Cystobasidium minutum MCA 4210]|uniref:uncharacterized protein n=1 Tax=Cystobasidium minutum MCA 4210 TaxID=1397322 RepID=UPI0034CFEFD1|eukprot:jgi/Rhomi1/175398/fgenesh1_kg.10_\